MSESCLVHNKTTKLVVLFVLVGAMMIVVPMLIEQVNARTVGTARSFRCCGPSPDPPFTDVQWGLTAGKWIMHPRVIEQGHLIEWVTVGDRFFGGGDESGSVSAQYGDKGRVTFYFRNPVFISNECLQSVPSNVHVLPCLIGRGDKVYARYSVSIQPFPADCTPRHCY